MAELRVGQEVTGTVLETGEQVRGIYAGSYWWNRAMSCCERASVLAGGREVTCTEESLEAVDEDYSNG